MSYRIIHGGAKEVLSSLSPESFDSLVTDPPAGIGFMTGIIDWDSDLGNRNRWVSWLTDILHKAYLCLKPNSLGLVWVIPKTCGWTQLACEYAGFTVIDFIVHLFGDRMPHAPGVLKPSHEEWLLIRKGSGQVRVDSNRLPGNRWPPNTVLSHLEECSETTCKESCVVEYLRQTTQFQKSRGDRIIRKEILTNRVYNWSRSKNKVTETTKPLDSGYADRYFPCLFYCSKAPTWERTLGLGDPGRTHPTVKPINLMTYLVGLITPHGGHVLDPFCGLGSTGIGCLKSGYNFTGIELDPSYATLAQQRLDAWSQELNPISCQETGSDRRVEEDETQGR